jgi:tetratricopeptide (TPR) repeat protein
VNTGLRLTWSVLALAACLLQVGCGSAESRKARYVQHGQGYFDAGNYDKARVEFRNAGQIDPKDAQVRYLLGQVAEKTGDIREAIGQYRAAIGMDPKNTQARAALGRLFIYGGLPDKALEVVAPGLAIAPKNAQLLTVRAASHLRLGDKDGALADGLAAVQMAPDDEYAIALLASIHEQRAQPDQAIQVVQEGLRRLPKNLDLRVILADLLMRKQLPRQAESQLQQIVALDPQGLVNRYRLAKFYLTQKNTDAAERALREAVAAVPDNADAKVQLVQFLAAQRGRDRAVSEVNQLIARAPDNDSLQVTLGQLLVQAGAVEQAERLFREVVARAGKRPDGQAARVHLAALLVGRSEMSAAGTLVDEVLKENARDNDALILRSQIALANGEAASAIADLRVVLRDQPNAVPVMRALAQAYERNDQLDLAAEAIRNALQIAPGDIPARFELAQLEIGQGKLENAAPLLTQLAKDDPLNVQVLTALFKVQSAQKQYAEARATAATVQRTQPNLGLGFYLSGLVDEIDGKSELAVHDYELALQIQPDASEPLLAVTRLDLRLKQSTRAAHRLEGIITAQPANALARTVQGEMLLAQNQSAAAIAAYQGAIKVAPKWANGYHGLALVQIAAKRDDDAVSTLRQGIANAQDASMLVVDLGGLLQRTGRADEAIALYDALLAHDPKSAFAANNLAMLLVTTKTDATSLARAQQLANQLASSSAAGVLDTRGWVKFKSGDYRGAASLLQQAVDKAPESPELRYHLAMAQLRDGAQPLAVKNLEAALRAQQPFPGIDEARAALAMAKKTSSTG